MLKDNFSLRRFIGSLPNEKKAEIILAGFPYDCTSSLRSGSRFAAREMRAYSHESIESFSFHSQLDLEDVPFFDAGDTDLMVGDPEMMIQEVRKTATTIVNQGYKLLGIGGEHLITFPLFLSIQSLYSQLTLIQLDAHADLRVEYEGNPFSHASVMNLCLDAGLSKLIQIGVRSCSREEWAIRNQNERIIPILDIQSLREAIELGENIYLSIDVDFFDPAFFPATGTPEAGGFSFFDFLDILKILKEKRAHIVGADLVEYIPDLDPSKISGAMAAKIIREVLFSMFFTP